MASGYGGLCRICVPRCAEGLRNDVQCCVGGISSLGGLVSVRLTATWRQVAGRAGRCRHRRYSTATQPQLLGRPAGANARFILDDCFACVWGNCRAHLNPDSIARPSFFVVLSLAPAIVVRADIGARETHHKLFPEGCCNVGAPLEFRTRGARIRRDFVAAASITDICVCYIFD